jgi:hypothetical protein
MAGGEWPPGACAPQPRAGGERLGGPRGTPHVAASSPAARMGRPPGRHTAPQGWLVTAQSASALEQTAGPATWRSQIGWPKVGSLVS